MKVDAKDCWETVRRAAREGDRDRYLAALLAPRARRDDLIALAAFAGAVMKIPYLVTEPHIGEIRIQWWRDTLSAGVEGGQSGDPVADAFVGVMARRGLALDDAGVLLDQLVDRLYGTDRGDTGTVASDIRRTQGVLFGFADRILGNSPSNAGAFEHAVQAYGLAQAGLMLPFDLARGRMPLPVDVFPDSATPDWHAAISALRRMAEAHLTAFRSACNAGQVWHLPALLPVALVEPYFEALSRAAHDPARAIADISPLTRVWRLGGARLRGRI